MGEVERSIIELKRPPLVTLCPQSHKTLGKKKNKYFGLLFLLVAQDISYSMHQKSVSHFTIIPVSISAKQMGL
jgi:hypothetical protein